MPKPSIYYGIKKINQRITQHLVRMLFLGGREGRGDLLQKRKLKIENKAILEVFNCPK
jgi:hypothetical protein